MRGAGAGTWRGPDGLRAGSLGSGGQAGALWRHRSVAASTRCASRRLLRSAPCPASQLRANCTTDEPGWSTYGAPAPPRSGLTGLQVGLIVAAAALVAASVALTAVLVMRWREHRQWEALKGADTELMLGVRPPERGALGCAGAAARSLPALAPALPCPRSARRRPTCP